MNFNLIILRKLLYFLFPILFLDVTPVVAQNQNKEFKFQYDAKNSINGSNFQYIELIDSRKDTTHYGIIQKGFFGKSAKVIANPSLEIQMQKYLQTITTGNVGSDTLVLQIRRLSFSELKGGISEKGFFDFRANLWQKKYGQYIPIDYIDSSFQVSGLDVSNKLLNKGSQVIHNFIRTHLTTLNLSAALLSLQDLENIDYKEKEKLPLYAAEHLTDGIYCTYENLKLQQPNYPLLDERDSKGRIKYYFYINEKGKKVKLKDKQIYAVVDKDTTYISTYYGYYPLIMENDEYYFYGLVDEGSSNFFVSAAIGSGFGGGFGGGMVGVGVGSTPTNVRKYKIKIDHIDGNFEKIEQIPD